MLFEPTEDQEMLADTLSRFVADAVTPNATAWSHAAKMPLDTLHGLRDLGLLGLELPESAGGAGFGSVEWVQAVEALAAGDGGLALALGAKIMITLHWHPLLATAALWSAWLLLALALEPVARRYLGARFPGAAQTSGT